MESHTPPSCGGANAFPESSDSTVDSDIDVFTGNLRLDARQRERGGAERRRPSSVPSFYARSVPVNWLRDDHEHADVAADSGAARAGGGHGLDVVHRTAS